MLIGKPAISVPRDRYLTPGPAPDIVEHPLFGALLVFVLTLAQPLVEALQGKRLGARLTPAFDLLAVARILPGHELLLAHGCFVQAPGKAPAAEQGAHGEVCGCRSRERLVLIDVGANLRQACFFGTQGPQPHANLACGGIGSVGGKALEAVKGFVFSHRR